jgi:hypothetical protein
MKHDPKIKPYQLFEDLAEKQRKVKANKRKVTLEEARKLAEWVKDTGKEKRTRDN